MNTDRKHTDREVALKIVAIYALFSGLWICISDIALPGFIPDPAILARISIFKDTLFIFLTVVFLYQLIKGYFNLSRQTEETRLKLESQACALDHSRQARQEALEKLAIVAGGVPTLIAHVDLNQRYLYVNSRYAAWVGKPESEIIGATIREVIGEEIYLTTIGCIQQVLNGRFAFMERKAGIQGEERIQHMSFIPRLDGHSAVTSYFALINDITDIRQAELALQASEQKFRNLLENVRLAALIIDHNGVITFCNDFITEISGWPPEEILDRNWFELFVPLEARETARSVLAPDCQMAAFSLHFEENLLTRAGAPRQVAWDMTRLYDAEGRLSGTALIGADVTEHRKAEEQLRQAHKMEAIGTLAGGVAHDFNNILTVIMGGAEMIHNYPDDSVQLSRQIIDAANRGAGLTHSLLAFSRNQKIDMTIIDLNSRIKQLEDLLCRIIGEDITITLSLCNGSLNVMADGGQLDQVVMNMISNARDAMPGGGSLKIATYLAERRRAVTGDEAPVVTYAVLEITDTGSGMSRATMERIFDPFYTTKGIGKGTGLGLAMAYGIIKRHDGCIEVDSTPEKGTVFRIFLPNMKQCPEPNFEKMRVHQRSGDETILLVEDDPVLLQIVKTMLERTGYRILSARNGEEGLAMFLATLDPIHLILTDVIMPKKNGLEMSREIHAHSPGIPTIFMSGYAADCMERLQNPGPAVHYISKPLKFTLLLEKIHEALTSTRQMPVPDAADPLSQSPYMETGNSG